MRQKIFILGIILCSIIILGCQPTCREPYIEYKKGDCCLDSDNNQICDEDEGMKTSDNGDTKIQQVIIQAPEKEECPYECCIGIDFNKKLCGEGYECKNYKCEMIDSDSDGLGDTEEKSLGTNPKIYDTDGDGLSDFQEVRNYNTNPLNKNTDDDRYGDKEDKEPLRTNSAELQIESEEILPTIEDIAELIDNFQSLEWWISQLSQAQTKEMIVTLTNKGDDYTDGFSFDVVTYVVFTKKERDGLLCVNERFLSKNILNTQTFSFSDVINPQQTSQKEIQVEMSTTVPTSLNPEECGGFQYCPCTQKITYVFENLEYEKYP